MTASRFSALFIALLLSLSSAVYAEGSLNYVITRAKELQKDRNYAESSKLLDRYIEMHNKNSLNAEPSNVIVLLSIQADNFYNLGITTRAAELYEKALKISDSIGDKRKSADICNTLFILHLFTGNNSLSRDLLSRSLKLYRSLGDSIGVCKILNNMGIMYFYHTDIDKSLEYYEKALDLAKEDKEIRGRILTNIAKSLVEKGELTKADAYLDDVLKLFDYRYNESDALQAWLNKAEILTKLGKKDQARKILNTIAGKINMRDQDRLIESYNSMANLRMELGDSVQGLRWLLKAKALTDSLKVNEENEQLREILVRYNTERIAEQNKLLEITTKRQSSSILTLIIISILVLAVSVYLIYRIKADRRKNLLIRAQNEQIARLEQQEHERKEEEYRQQLDYKNRQLTTYSIDAASISELHKLVLDSLKDLRRNADVKMRREIDTSITLLQNYNRTEVAEDFRVHFNDVHPDLLKALSEKFPVLTANDLRLCSYIYLGMSTKEIAALTFREIRSVESTRFRLRKKLGLSNDQTLHNFLHNLQTTDNQS